MPEQPPKPRRRRESFDNHNGGGKACTSIGVGEQNGGEGDDAVTYRHCCKDQKNQRNMTSGDE
jgi:hypothetical protein